ncbi:protein-disulfide isomerase, partial [bacterium]|nr:protein-disulfide isomerase [bacterium]
MGRKDRKEREIKRDNYATKHSAAKKKETLIAIAVLSVIAVIVGYAVILFLNMTVEAPGGPENAGALGSEHA